MATKTGKIVADFTTSLATALSVGATTATLQSAADDDGVALPTGKYYLAIDGANSAKEHIYCTLTGTALTDIKSISRQGVETTGVVRAHRLGATVTLTDFAYIKTINDLVSGAVDLDATDPLKYDAAPTLTIGSNEIATVKYVDDTAIAGSPLATASTAGIIELATSAEIDANTATGSTGAAIVVTPDQLLNSKYGQLVTAQSTPNMTVAVKAFSIAELSYAGGSTSTITAPVTNPRIDLVVLTSAGALDVRTGTEAASPTAPTPTDGDIVLANITLATSTTAITNSLISNYKPARYFAPTNDLQKTFTSTTTSGDISTLTAVAASGNNQVKAITVTTNSGETATTVPSNPSGSVGGRDIAIYTDTENIRIQNCYATNPFINILTMDSTETNVVNSFAGSASPSGLPTVPYRTSACKISSDKILFVFTPSNGSTISQYYTAVFTVSTRTFGTATLVTGGYTDPGTVGITTMSEISVSKLDTDKALFFFRKNGTSDLNCMVLTVSGTTVTGNTPVQVDTTNSTYFMTSDQLSTDKVLVVYSGTGITPKARVITVSGTTPTVGASTQIEVGTGQFYMTVNTINSGKCILTRKLTGSSTQYIANILTVSGTTVTSNTDFNLLPAAVTGQAGFMWPLVIGNTVIVAAPYITTSKLIVHTLDCSGTTITGSSVTTTNTYNFDSSMTAVTRLKPFIVLVTNAYFATPSSSAKIVTNLVSNISLKVGIAKNTTTSGNPADIYINSQIVSGFTGLVAGSKYYINENGSPSLQSGLQTKTYGIAISTTEMLLD